jgi:phage tail sheath protein FI
MPTYLHPGVYIEEIPSGAKPIEGVSTSTAAFVGYTTKGPVNDPVLIFKFDDYVRRFGGLRSLGQEAEGDPMGFSVKAFFQNGGTKAYIVRLAQDDTQNPLAAATGFLGVPGNTDDVAVVSAVNEGAWGNGLIVEVSPKESDPNLYTVEVGREDDRGDFSVLESFGDVSFDDQSPRFIEGVINGVSENVKVEIEDRGDVTIPDEDFLGTLTSGDLSALDLDFSGASAGDRTMQLSLDGTTGFSVVLPDQVFTSLDDVAAEIQSVVRTGASAERRTEFTAVAGDDKLVLTSGTRAEDSSVSASGVLATTLKLTGDDEVAKTGAESVSDLDETELSGGGDGEPADDSAYDAVFTAFEKIRDISILCLPGKAWDSDGQPVIQSAVAHAEKMKSRMVIVDPPADTELKTEKNVTDLGLPTSTYSVLYYPWVKVANPFFDAEDNPGVPTTLLVPPGGYAAGMWSKIDGRRGVWKAPAGVETALLGLSGAQYVVEDAEQDQLNPLGVNALRRLPGFGNVIWGSRTLSTKANPEWRYVPVRRTAIFIEQSIYGGIQWAVFEPNDHRLWSALRLNMEAFMDGLFRSGAFQGQKASDAYFVRCGLGDTMTQDDIDRGQVIAIVGFAPLKPAEFVIVRIQQKVAQQ